MSHDKNVQLRRDTKKVFQILMPQLPPQLIDMTTHIMFQAPNKEEGKSPPRETFVLKRVDSCEGMLTLSSTKPAKNKKHDMQFQVQD